MWCCGCPDFGIGSKHVRETTIGSGRGWSQVEQNLKKFGISKNFKKNGSKSTVSVYSALLDQPDSILVTRFVERGWLSSSPFRTLKDITLSSANQNYNEVLQAVVRLQ